MPSPEHTFPLVDSSYENQEILRCIETLLSGQLTMGLGLHSSGVEGINGVVQLDAKRLARVEQAR